jgi:hypothetical protein
MAANISGVIVPLTVAAAIAQYKFLELSSTNAVATAANAAGDDVVGISLEARSAAQITAGDTRIPVLLPGCVAKVLAGAAIDITAAAVPVTTDASGRAVAVAAATDRILGYALQSAGAANEVIEILFLKGADRRDA